jgi:TetR/AcrR family transcriptional repressor of mexJK operon
MFLERGVKAAAVEAIAAQAGVSKATFYKHFADKATLFEAAVRREMQRIEVAQQVPRGSEPDMSLEATLRQFGIGLMSFLFSPAAVDFYNALSAELARHKTLARRFYDLGPGRTRANLAALLTAAAKNGELKIVDAEEAAEHLVGLWQGISNYQLSLGIGVDSIRRSIPKRVDAGVRVFMAAYGNAGA